MQQDTSSPLNLNKSLRFQFGKNWENFLKQLTEERIDEAVKSLQEMLGVETLKGKTFLDIGSGSGLFSLAAKRLGAEVFSFDVDPNSVGCTHYLKEKYYPRDSTWKVESGSVLDEEYIKSLGEFDVVYSWGVLHHTGSMWKAIDNALIPIKENGLFFIAIYNDMGNKSYRWRRIKKIYCSSFMGKLLVTSIVGSYMTIGNIYSSTVNTRKPFKYIKDYKSSRGMSFFTDLADWLGGYPYEFSTPDKIIMPLFKKGFQLENILCVNGHGNNQFVFRKASKS
jgi:2-polyprenyl-3-methyl-5-hydroxy-6-metoxy-1,4-benzoquinol methylase